jgi:hypothetical protein
MRQMKRILVLLAIAALAIPTAASAKGPASAVIEGPGIEGGRKVPGAGEYRGTPLGDLTHYTGFFRAVWGPEPMSKDRPKGDLGPKYTVTYSLPMGEKTVDIRQDLYPYANPPVTYTEPGQKVYENDETHGGWYTAGIPALRVRLIEAHLLPVVPPAEARPIDEVALLSDERLLAIAVAMGLVVGGTAVFLRRRTRTAAAA